MKQLISGAGGIVEGAPHGQALRRHVDDRSRHLAAVAARLGERGVRFHRRAGLGRGRRAEDGTLAIMVGGDARDSQEARPALAAMGANIVHVGAVGAGRWRSSATI